MSEEMLPVNNHNLIIGSNENKIELLKARKTELLLGKDLAKNPHEIRRIENLLKNVEGLIKKHDLSTTIQRRMKKI
jgi:hypothetical protein